VTSADYNRNNNYHESHSFSPPSSSMFSTYEKEGLYKAIFSRRDVRSHFITDKPVPDDVLFRIRNAAHHAPSVGYSQPWNFIVIKDRSLRRQVKELFLWEKGLNLIVIQIFGAGRDTKYVFAPVMSNLCSSLFFCFYHRSKCRFSYLPLYCYCYCFL